MNKRNKSKTLFLEYGLVLFGFLLMYVFILPQSDVFIFAQNTDGSFESAWEFSLNYGNGRLFGNLIGVYFSSHFIYAGFIVAVILFILVFLMNYLLLNHDVYSVFPLAVLIAIPSTGIVTECYYLFAGFCNYVIPIMLLLISLSALKMLHKEGIGTWKNVAFLTASLFCSFSSCLFSENTTILVVVIFFSLIIWSYVDKKKICLACFLNFILSAFGALIMFIIPIITHTSEKMDGYRSIASGFWGIIRQCVVSFCQFADCFNHMYSVLFLFSFAMLLLCLRLNYRSAFCRYLQITTYSLYPFLCLAMNQLDSHSLAASLTIVKMIDGAALLVYAINVFISIIHIKEKAFRLRYLLVAMVTLFSVAPMMIVNMSGHRTYYTTFLCVISFSLMIIRDVLPKSLRTIINETRNRKALACAAGACFAVVTIVMVMLSVFNYDFYVIRSEELAKKISANEPLMVPIMPFDSISVEGTLCSTLYFAYENVDLDKTVISMDYWEKFLQYRDQIVNNPIQAISFAVSNWKYKDPLYPQSLCG